MNAEPERQFIKLVQGHLKYLRAGQDFTVDQPLKPLGLDSMAAVDLLLDIEDTYGIVFSDAYLTDQTFATVSTVWNALQQQTEATR